MEAVGRSVGPPCDRGDVADELERRGVPRNEVSRRKQKKSCIDDRGHHLVTDMEVSWWLHDGRVCCGSALEHLGFRCHRVLRPKYNA